MAHSGVVRLAMSKAIKNGKDVNKAIRKAK